MVERKRFPDSVGERFEIDMTDAYGPQSAVDADRSAPDACVADRPTIGPLEIQGDGTVDLNYRVIEVPEK